jgi:hypothetical protein
LETEGGKVAPMNQGDLRGTRTVFMLGDTSRRAATQESERP